MASSPKLACSPSATLPEFSAPSAIRRAAAVHALEWWHGVEAPGAPALPRFSLGGAAGRCRCGVVDEPWGGPRCLAPGAPTAPLGGMATSGDTLARGEAASPRREPVRAALCDID
jgi:hypothetical protein